jgi:hypothetical protein
VDIIIEFLNVYNTFKSSNLIPKIALYVNFSWIHNAGLLLNLANNVDDLDLDIIYC